MCVCSVAHSCLIHCDSMDSSPPGSSVHGIFQAAYWSGLPCSTPGDLPDQGIKPVFPLSSALAGVFFMTVPPGKAKNWKVWPLLTHTNLDLPGSYADLQSSG